MTPEQLKRIEVCPLAIDVRGSSVRVVIAVDRYSVAHIATGINDREAYAHLFAASLDMLADHRNNAADLEHLVNAIDANAPLPTELFDRIVMCLERSRASIAKGEGGGS